MRLSGTTVSGCDAAEGGALYVETGDAVLSNGTLLFSNVASIKGSAYFIAAGSVTYELPAPGGHWLPNGRCEAYREACPTWSGQYRGKKMIHVPNPYCMAIYDQCKLLPDSDDAPPSVDGRNCTRRLPYTQPCNWIDKPHLLGLRMYRLPQGTGEQTFPFACAPGVEGSSDADEQISALCKGQCPPGRMCPHAATVDPKLCPSAHFCSRGTSVPTPCRVARLQPEP